MAKKRAYRRNARQRAADKSLHETFSRNRPSMASLLESGEYVGPLSQDVYVEMRRMISVLKEAREARAFSLSELAKRCGIDKAALSRLESGVRTNITLETLSRWAQGLDIRLSIQLEPFAGHKV